MTKIPESLHLKLERFSSRTVNSQYVLLMPDSCVDKVESLDSFLDKSKMCLSDAKHNNYESPQNYVISIFWSTQEEKSPNNFVEKSGLRLNSQLKKLILNSNDFMDYISKKSTLFSTQKSQDYYYLNIALLKFNETPNFSEYGLDLNTNFHHILNYRESRGPKCGNWEIKTCRETVLESTDPINFITRADEIFFFFNDYFDEREKEPHHQGIKPYINLESNLGNPNELNLRNQIYAENKLKLVTLSRDIKRTYNLLSNYDFLKKNWDGKINLGVPFTKMSEGFDLREDGDFYRFNNLIEMSKDKIESELNSLYLQKLDLNLKITKALLSSE